MARGYPDYFGQSIFPAKGAYTKNAGSNAVNTDAEFTLRTVLGQGVLFGGYFNSTDADMHKDDQVNLYVDGNRVTIGILSFLFDNKIWRPNESPIYITCYDEITPQYAIGISSGIVFTTSLHLKFTRKTAVDRTVNCGLFYSLLTG